MRLTPFVVSGVSLRTHVSISPLPLRNNGTKTAPQRPMVAAGGTEGGRHPCSADGTFYVRLGLGDGVTADVSAPVRRSTRIANTALLRAVSSKSAQIIRSHESR